jgi:lipoic acid synthetase
LILGDTCTRHCRFCAIPAGALLPPRADEPEAVAQAAREMKLRYVVITSVTRDDLPDGGSDHFAQTIRAVRQECPGARIEVLTPDFQGSVDAIRTVLAAAPDVFNHNIETVPTLYADVRPEANYQQSLDVLAAAKAENVCLTKSGLMVGLGETDAQVRDVLTDLRAVDVDIVTIGQYLAPSDAHVPVARFVEPEQFERWKTLGESMGFAAVASGPFVRSSYHAHEVFETSHDAGHE